MTPTKITDWLTVYVTGTVFTAPECRRIGLGGTLADGTKLITAAVKEKHGPRLIECEDGQVYELEGDPLPDWVAFCARIGKPVNFADPIKLIDKDRP